MSLQAEGGRRRRFAANPVLARELKERMRSRRATVILVVYLTLLAGVLYLSYRMGLLSLRSQMFGGGGFVGSSMGAAALGRLMFEVLMIFLLSLIAFIAPGASTGAIAGERERGTLHLLQVTLLRPASIILGKLGASIGFVLLLLVASLPLLAVALILGGVTPGQALRGMVVVTVLAIFLATLGVFFSTIARRTLHATIATYAATFVLLFGTILTYGAERIAASSGFELMERPVSTYLNPFAALTDAVVDRRGNAGILPSPLSMARQMIPSFLPGTARFSEPPQVITTGEDEGRSWVLTARKDPNGGVCVGFQDNQGGSETCGSSEPMTVAQAPTAEGRQAYFGPLTGDVRKVVVELEEGKPMEVEPLTDEAREAGFDDVTFFVFELEEGQRAVEIRALDKSDEEIASQSLAEMPILKPGVVVEDGVEVPVPRPVGTPPPPPATAPAPPDGVEVRRILPAAPLAVQAPDPAALPAVDPALPPPVAEGQVLIDPVPGPEPGMLPPGRQPADEPLRVWVVHTVVLLGFSALLVVAGSYQLRRPKMPSLLPWSRRRSSA
ncbi:MAG TPA: ABC transporter permease subunit [Actinomycetota bacterium]|nr:ABC transporter permease subunit [Actinomycetota bacterium]